MVYLFLADGFEEVEALGTVDVLRRCGVEVQMLSVTGKRIVTGAHGLVVKADSLFRKKHLYHAQAMVLPGGMKGATTLNSNSVLKLVLTQRASQGELIAAICAAPMVLGELGLLRGRHATCYPGMESHLEGAIYHDNCYVVEDANLITGSGPAATLSFAYSIARRLVPAVVVEEVERGMLAMGHLDSKYPQPVLRFHCEQTGA